MTQQIVNDTNAPDLSVVNLVSAATVELFRQTVADAFHSASSTTLDGSPRHTFGDLSEGIADIIIETTVQGASLVEVHIIDPDWKLLRSDFITVDDSGFLYPPVTMNFPPGTQMQWTLVECRPSTVDNGTEPNIVFVFEDTIVNTLRQVDAANGGVNGSYQGETLAHWMKRLVDAANKVRGTDIQFVPWISPLDPDFAAPAIPSDAGHPNLSNVTAQRTHYQEKLSAAHRKKVAAEAKAILLAAERAVAALHGKGSLLYLAPAPTPSGDPPPGFPPPAPAPPGYHYGPLGQLVTNGPGL